MAKTRAQLNKGIRQEALREQLSAQGHVQHAVDITKKFDKPLDKADMERLKSKFDMHMKLVDKYLPSLKATEITGEDGGPVVTKTVIELVETERGVEFVKPAND
jgi:hypothetical protein